MTIPPRKKAVRATSSSPAAAGVTAQGVAPTSARVAACSEGDGDVMTVDEAAVFLKVGRNTVYEACARNHLPYRRVGRQIRLSRAALVAWLASWSKQDAQKGQ